MGSRQFAEDVFEMRSQNLKARLLLGDADGDGNYNSSINSTRR